MKTFISILKKFIAAFLIITFIANIGSGYKFIRYLVTGKQLLNIVNNVTDKKVDTAGVLNYAEQVANGESYLDKDIGNKVDGLLDGTSDYYNDTESDLLKDINQDESSSNDISKVALEKVTIKQVIDGDTIHVYNNAGEVVKVRFIGVNSQEINTDAGKLASEYTESKLKEGSTVYLQYDLGKYDVYDRTLAYVWLKSDIDTSSTDDIVDYMYNAILLIDGYADVMTVEPNIKYKNVFEKLQDVRNSKVK